MFCNLNRITCNNINTSMAIPMHSEQHQWPFYFLHIFWLTPMLIQSLFSFLINSNTHSTLFVRFCLFLYNINAFRTILMLIPSFLFISNWHQRILNDTNAHCICTGRFCSTATYTKQKCLSRSFYSFVLHLNSVIIMDNTLLFASS